MLQSGHTHLAALSLDICWSVVCALQCCSARRRVMNIKHASARSTSCRWRRLCCTYSLQPASVFRSACLCLWACSSRGKKRTGMVQHTTTVARLASLLDVRFALQVQPDLH